MIDLTGPLATDARAEEYDVRRVKKALNRLGHYTPFDKTGITGMTDAQLFDAIKAFQRSQNLPATGMIKPGDETLAALNDALARAPDGYYIWRTVGDDKVRSEHAHYNNTLRAWSDAPDPGEDYNCRCWAEPTDAINSTIGPFDILAGGLALRGGVAATTLASRLLSARMRDIGWTQSIPRAQLQSKFKHAKVFGIRGNPNNKNLATFKKALENHVRSSDTQIIKGTYHKRPVTHYYNAKTRINIIRNERGNFESAWKLSEDQVKHMLKNGKLGGSR